MTDAEREIYKLTMGLRNGDFRPGRERQAAKERLAQLRGDDRPRGVIKLCRPLDQRTR